MDRPNSGISVVVPTLNRGPFLIDTLHDLLAQQHRPLEILIVDQSSEENMALLALVLKHRDLLSYQRVSFRGLPLARNYGWQNAKYDAIIFVDDDIRCGPGLVSEHLRMLRKPNCGMVAGGVEEHNCAKTQSKKPGHFNFWTANPIRNFAAQEECLTDHVAGCNFSVWRSVLEAAGGFDEALACGAALYEETEFCLRVRRLGFDIHFNGNARLDHLVAGSGGCRVLQIPRYVRSLGHNRAMVIKRHLRWFQAPTAWARLVLLLMSYAVRYRDGRALGEGLCGVLEGMAAAKRPPLCGRYKAESALQESPAFL